MNLFCTVNGKASVSKCLTKHGSFDIVLGNAAVGSELTHHCAISEHQKSKRCISYRQFIL